MLPSKEIAQANKETSALEKSARALTLTTPEDVTHATSLLEAVKNAKKALTTRREEITRPLMAGLASTRALFKPIEGTLLSAEEIVKSKMLAYTLIEDEKKARVHARLAKGSLKQETALAKLEEIGSVKMKTRTLTKVRITDESLIPREYLVPNMTFITNAVLHDGITVPGVEMYKEKIVHG